MQVTAFIKACKEQIDILKNSINDDEANSKGWLGLRTDNSNADTVAHKHGVVRICYSFFLIEFIHLFGFIVILICSKLHCMLTEVHFSFSFSFFPFFVIW